MCIPKSIRVAIYIVALITSLLVALLMAPGTARYHITERYDLTGTVGSVPVYLSVLTPRSGPYQTVTAADVAWDGEITRKPEAAGDLILLSGTLDSSGQRVATLTYDVTLRQGPVTWQAPLDPAYIRPQVNVESDAAVLVAEAGALTRSRPAATARDIFRYASRQLSWPTGTRINVESSALDAYQTGVGGCAEFANLMVALCRAAEVPALTVSGLAFSPLMPPFLKRTASWNHPAGSHAWVEVHTGDAWTLADPSWASRVPYKRLWFGQSDGTHLSYGETSVHDAAIEALTQWAETHGDLIGAMSAPLKFAAAAGTAEGDAPATVVPEVTVRKSWDSRWFAAAAVYVVLILLFAVVERGFRHKAGG